MSQPVQDFAPREASRPLTRLPFWQNGHALAVAGAATASLKAVLVKLAYAAAPITPVALLNLRMLLSLPLFLLLFLSGKGKPLTARHLAMLLVLGFCGYYFSSLADFIGLQYISAGLERLILFTYPGFVVLLEGLVRRKALRRGTVAALGLSYLGLAIAFSHDLQLGEREAVLVGSAWVLASAFSFALYYLGAGRLIEEIGSARFAGGVGLTASALMLSHGALTEELATYTQLPAAVWWAALAMALLSTVLPSWLNAQAMARIGASETAAIGNLGPVLTIALGWLVLAEPFSAQQLLGMILVILGVRRMSR